MVLLKIELWNKLVSVSYVLFKIRRILRLLFLCL
jgi:hypothetical protein